MKKGVYRKIKSKCSYSNKTEKSFCHRLFILICRFVVDECVFLSSLTLFLISLRSVLCIFSVCFCIIFISSSSVNFSGLILFKYLVWCVNWPQENKIWVWNVNHLIRMPNWKFQLKKKWRRLIKECDKKRNE